MFVFASLTGERATYIVEKVSLRYSRGGLNCIVEYVEMGLLPPDSENGERIFLLTLSTFFDQIYLNHPKKALFFSG